MDDKDNSGDGWYGIYQQNKLGDKHNQMDPKVEKSNVILVGVNYIGLTYNNVARYCYHKKCWVNKTHTRGLHVACRKKWLSFKLPPTHPFILKLTEKGNVGRKNPLLLWTLL